MRWIVLVNISHRKVIGLACGLYLACAIGSIIPDIDHIPMALGISDYGGRIAHNTLFAIAIFCVGGVVAYLSGFIAFRVLERIDDDVM